MYIFVEKKRKKYLYLSGYQTYQEPLLKLMFYINQGSRGRRILRTGTHKSGSGLLKIPEAESAGRMFFPRGTTTNYDRIIWLKTKVRHVLYIPLVAS